MLALKPTKLRKVLCLGAHSDDIEIGCGGTVLKLIQGDPTIRFYWAVFSGNDMRRREARRSAQEFLKGAATGTVLIKGFQESYFPSQWPAVKDSFEAIRKVFEPDLVFTHYREDRHQDHRVLSDLAWNTFRNHLILEYEIPKYDGDLGVPNLFVELDGALCRKKVQAIQRCFVSQKSKHWFDERTFLALLRLRGVECASAGGYAEAFYCRKIVWL